MGTMPHPISRNDLRWLESQLLDWRAEGLVDDGAADAIRSRYEVSARPQVTRLFLGLGAALAGVGLLWLVAANVDVEAIGPLWRFVLVTALWLALTAGAELARARGAGALLREPLSLLSALGFGGALFQAAQSLQVPAYEPRLLLAWGAGALLYAYAVSARGALIVGVAAVTGWWTWALFDAAGDGLSGAVAGLAVTAPAAAAAAALHLDERFAEPWRFSAAVLALVAIFIVAAGGTERTGLPVLELVAGAVAAAGLCALAARRAAGDRPELAGAAALAALTVLLVVVGPAHAGLEQREGAGAVHALVASAVFLAAAVGVALAGARHSMPSLTNLAFGALLVFAAVQSFGLLAELLSGAALLLTIGIGLLVIGVLLDRGRRHLLEEGAG